MPVKQAPLLPRADAGNRGLFLVVSALCFLTSFMSLTTRVTFSAARDWTSRATNELTVRVLGDPSDRTKALAAIEQEDGVASARIVARAEAEALLKPWLGTGLPGDLPLPGLIAVRAQPGQSDLGSILAGRLDDAGLTVRVDDHFNWSKPLRRSLRMLQVGALTVLFILWLTAILVISFATRTALVAHHNIVEVLHLAGARDRFIATLFERRFLALGVRAGVVGALCAFVTCWLIGLGAGQREEYVWLSAHISLETTDLLVFSTAPLLSGLVAMASARATALRALSNLI